MNETIQTILARRSIRSFRPDPLSDQDLDVIVQAGLFAPSGMNRQGVRLVVIRDKNLIAQMDALNAAEILRQGYHLPRLQADDPNYSAFWHAPVVILVAEDKTATWGHFDAGAATENMCLAATSLGIGSLIVGSSRFVFFDSPDADSVIARFALPEGYGYVVTLALGYVDGGLPAPPPRKPDRALYIDG